MNTHMMCI